MDFAELNDIFKEAVFVQRFTDMAVIILTGNLEPTWGDWERLTMLNDFKCGNNGYDFDEYDFDEYDVDELDKGC